MSELLLTPFALENHFLLQTLDADSPFTTKAALAAYLNRDPSNLNKTLNRLEAEGLVEAGGMALTERGRGALSQYLRMSQPAAAPYQIFAHADLEPDALNPRRTRDQSAIAALADGIVAAGRILEPILVRQSAEPDGKPRIKAGVTRWTAVGQAIADGRLPADFPIPAEVRESTDTETRREAAAENEVRSDLNPMDRARAYDDLAILDGLENAAIAQLVGRTPESIQQHRRLLRLPAADQQRVMRREISIQEALKTMAKPRADKAWFPGHDHILVLAELAAKIQDAPHPTYADSTEAGRSAQTDSLLGKLTFEGYSGWASTLTSTRIWLRPKAFELLETNGLRLSSPGFLEAAYAMAGLTEQQTWDLAVAGDHVTDWLNYRPSGKLAAETAQAPEAKPAADTEGEYDSWRPNRPQFLRLVEIAHAVEHRPSATYPSWTDIADEAHADRDLELLARKGLLTTIRGPAGSAAKTMPKGDELLASVFADGGVTADNLRWARLQSGVTDVLISQLEEADGYVSPWLNPSPSVARRAPADAPGAEVSHAASAPLSPPEPAAPPPTAVEGTADLEELDAELEEGLAQQAAMLAEVRKKVSTGLFGKNGANFDAMTFRDLLVAAGMNGPFEPGDDEEPGCVIAQDANCVAVCGPDGERIDDLAAARAELVAFSLNAVAGFGVQDRTKA